MGLTAQRTPPRRRLARLLPLLLCFACRQVSLVEGPRERIVVSDGWLAMGTFFEADLRVHSGQEIEARAWLAWARGEIERLEAIYSRWQSQSEVSWLNRRLVRARAGEPIPLGPELRAILVEALEVGVRSQGAFDVTVGRSLALWREAARSGRMPTEEAVAEARRSVGFRSLSIGDEAGLVAAMTGIEIDLDGLSKGAVLDRLAVRLETTLPGAPALLTFGQSSVLAIGDPDGHGWRLAVRSRREGEPILARLVLRDRALSVSSSHGGGVEIGGQRFSHVIDPRAGRPVPGLVEAIVVGRRAAQVDAWSTAMLVVGGTPSELRASLAALEREGLEAWVEGPSTSERTTRWLEFEASWEGVSLPDGQSAPDSPASAQSRRASSLHEHARPVPPHEPFSSRPVNTTPTAMAATARQKIVAVAKNVVIGFSGNRG